MPNEPNPPAPARQINRRDLSAVWRLLSYIAPYGWTVAGAGLALVIAASGVLAIGQGIKMVVDSGFSTGQTGMLNRMLLVVLAIVSVVALATAIRFYLVSWLGERIAADLRKAVFGHVLTLDPGYFETHRVGDLASRVITDTALIETIFGSSLSIFIRNSLMLAGGILLLIVTSPKLSMLVILGVPLVAVPIILFGRRVRRLSRATQNRVADITTHVEETLHAIRTVQAFVHEDIDRQRFSDRVDKAFQTAVRRIRQRAFLTGAAILITFTAVGVILWIGGHDVLAERMSMGDLAAFVFYAMLVAGSLGAISEVIGDLLRGVGASERLFELLDAVPNIDERRHPLALPEPPKGAVALEDVRFCYPSRPEIPALDGVGLQVESGEKLALVGPSGAGKSTIIQLLLRFYDPQQGRILFDGVDIREVDPKALRRQIGLVPQEPVLFAADAWENIRYGRPDASEAEIRAAAGAAHAAEFLDRLPQGFDSYLGERGVRLSGGQRQRIAIARAILRDPAVLLLDEATSSLDAESERVVQEALESLMQGRTSIIIAHRLATVQQCDRIAVLDRGRLHAVGTHRQLIRQSTLYARLAALQFGEEAGVESGLG